MSVLGPALPCFVAPSRPASGRGNPNTNGQAGLIGQEYTDNTTGRVYMKGGNVRDLGWFPIGTATGNAAVLYGTDGQASPVGVVSAAGPVIWYGKNGSVWVKTDPGVNTSNWHAVLIPLGFDSGPFFGSGFVDPWFLTQFYVMNNPQRDGGLTRLTWSVPNLALPFFVSFVGGTNDLYWNSINDIHGALSLKGLIDPPTIQVYVSQGYVWGVNRTADFNPLVYTSTQLDVIRFNGYLVTQNTISSLNVGVPIGNGVKLEWQAAP